MERSLKLVPGDGRASLDSPESLAVPPFQNPDMQNESLPLCDERGSQLRDDTGRLLSYSEAEAVPLISSGMMSLRRGRGKNSPRYLVFRNGAPPKNFQSKSNLSSGSPYSVREHVGDRFYVYKHVAHRCSAAASTEKQMAEPIKASCM